MLNKLSSRKIALLSPILLSTITLISFCILKTSSVNAAVDNIAITVPDSCSLSSTTDSTHTSNIYNGTYKEDIGTTTLTAFCNDNNGFSIYAIGYSNEVDGNNELIGSFSKQNIITGTNISGNTSNWAMKVTKETNDTLSYLPNNLSIDNSFDNYHAVPNEYTKVATNTSSTDETIGSVLKTTYAVYISPTQPVDEYSGKVKYILIHQDETTTPELPAEPKTVTVNYHGNGATFENGSTTNTVVYTSTPMYVATTPTIVKTTNLDNDGNKINNAGYDMTGCNIVSIDPDGTKTNGMSMNMDGYKLMYEVVTFPGAEKLVAEVKYGVDVEDSNGGFVIMKGEWTISEETPDDNDIIKMIEDKKERDVFTRVIDDNAITIILAHDDKSPSSDYNYGVYVKVSPIYTAEVEGTETTNDFYNVPTSEGSYITPNTTYGMWQADISEEHYDLFDEEAVIELIEDNTNELDGKTIDLNWTVLSAMQNWNGCSSLSIGNKTFLADFRDGTIYHATRLADGNCWMTDNLALDLVNIDLATLKGQTNASDETLEYLKGERVGTASDKYATSAVANWEKYRDDDYSNPLINMKHEKEVHVYEELASTNGNERVGGYYNFCAASAGSYCYGDGTDYNASSIDNYVDTTEDICPTGWRLPLRDEFSALGNFYDAYELGSTFSTPVSGTIRDGSVHHMGTSAAYWASGLYYRSSQSALELEIGPYVGGSGYSVSKYSDRGYGYSVRCIMQTE